jgi:hypothetical protein
VLGANHELVAARFRGEHRAFPADRELVRVELLLGVLGQLRPGRAEVEVHHGVGAVDEPGLAPEVARGEVLAVQPLFVIRLRRRPEAGHDVGDGVPVLADGQARQIDARRLEAGLGSGRVEGVVDVRRDELRPGRVEPARVVLRHRPVDGLCELRG